MKRVAVSQRVDVFSERCERRDALDQNLTVWLCSAGFLPFPVPNALATDAELLTWLKAVDPCGLLLSGGGEIGENLQRDFTESVMLRYAESHRLPLLGICRGMQMLAHFHSTGLKPVGGHVHKKHILCGEINGEANSYHNFSLSTCPIGFYVLAYSEDGEIEAIRHEIFPWEGWMWHPEREPLFSRRDTKRLKDLFT